MLIDNEASDLEEVTPQDEIESTSPKEEEKRSKEAEETQPTADEQSESVTPVVEEKKKVSDPAENDETVEEGEEDHIKTEPNSHNSTSTDNPSPTEETEGKDPTQEESVKEPQIAEEEDSPTSEEPSTEEPSEGPTSEDPEAEGKEEEVPNAETAAPEPAVVLNEEQTEILAKIQEIIEDEEDTVKLIESSPENLISLIAFLSTGNVGANSAKVAIIKNSFDAIRAKGDVSEELTESFREQLAGFNKLRAASKKQAENQKVSNAQKKRDLLAQLKEIVDSDDVYRINEVREVQDAWKKIGHVPKRDLDVMYREYRSLLDNFYQKREMHFELLEYDRRINLQEKEKLIVEAKKLIPEDDRKDDVEVWKKKMDMFHELQQQWRSIGHVPREDMERIRDEFRNVVDQFFEARQEYVDIIDKHREENAEKKEGLLVKMQEYTTFEAKKPREWNEATQAFRALQEEWKMLGPAPKAVNNELWQKYRKVADEFFTAKSNFFKALDEMRAQNLTQKIALCEQVEELVRNENWEKTARQLKKLQQEWKDIGPVPERHSNKVWNRFKSACDSFFEHRRTHYQALHKGENENLEKKRTLIEEVKGLIDDYETDVDIAIERVKEIQREWKKIGKVPYKEKDRIWEEFRGEVDVFFNNLTGKREKMRNVRFQSSLEVIKDDDKRVRHIRAKISSIRKRVQRAQEKVDQYSNNMMFIAKGKSGDKLRKQIQDELDKEIEQIDTWKKQMRELDHLMRNPPEEETAPESPEVSSNPSKEDQEESPKAEDSTASETSDTDDPKAAPVEPAANAVEEKTPETADPSEALTEGESPTEETTPTEEPAKEEESQAETSPEEPTETSPDKADEAESPSPDEPPKA